VGERTVKEARRPCPICRHTGVEVLHTQTYVLPERHPLEAGYDVVCCDCCGFVYADTDIPQAAYDRYYAELSKYEDTTTGTGGGDQPWDDKRLAEMAETIMAHLPSRETKVVDIGCANGGLLRHLSALGVRHLQGVDPSPRCAAATGRIAGAVGTVGSLFSLPAGLDHADCVVLSHVMEHIEEVREGIAVIRRLLTEDGVIYIEVPDATRYTDCLAAPFQDFNTEHINHFGPASLRRLLASEGFDVLAVERRMISAAAGIPYPAVYAIGRVRARPDGSAPERDAELRTAIVEYVRRSAELMRALDARLATMLDGKTPIVVWGVGQLTFKLLAMTRLSEAPIQAFIDTNPKYHGATLRGVPIHPPESLRDFTGPVLVATLLHGDSILARMRELGAPNRALRLEGAASR
jgi:SAM-dependent methyltransferase